jgi:hypothetical protein
MNMPEVVSHPDFADSRSILRIPTMSATCYDLMSATCYDLKPVTSAG